MKRFCMWEVGANKRGERVLLLIVKRADFNVMVTGEKAVEFRKKTRYWDVRLTHEDGSFRDTRWVPRWMQDLQKGQNRVVKL